MKKLFALLVAVLLLVPCLALAETDLLSADPAEVMTFDRQSHVTDWEGTWVLAAAYVGEDFADEYDVAVHGMLPVKENAATLVISTILDASANDKQLGTMVDVASYIHGHTHDLAGVLTFSPDVTDDEPYTVKSAWDEWPNNVIRGELDGDFNYGPAKTHIKGEEDDCHWEDITGVEIEDIEEMKYIGMSKTGHLILCYSDDNVAKKDGEVGFAYIFVRAE